MNRKTKKVIYYIGIFILVICLICIMILNIQKYFFSDYKFPEYCERSTRITNDHNSTLKIDSINGIKLGEEIDLIPGGFIELRIVNGCEKIK